MTRVVIEATREDADLLSRCILTPPEGFTVGHTYNVLNRITRAIREQTPEPLVIPENLGAVVEGAPGYTFILVRKGVEAGWYCPERDTYFLGYIVEETATRVLSEGVPA
jgi:hypothetical protein